MPANLYQRFLVRFCQRKIDVGQLDRLLFITLAPEKRYPFHRTMRVVTEVFILEIMVYDDGAQPTLLGHCNQAIGDNAGVKNNSIELATLNVCRGCAEISVHFACENPYQFNNFGQFVADRYKFDAGVDALKQPFPLLDRIEQSHLVRQLCEGIDVGAGGKCAASWG